MHYFRFVILLSLHRIEVSRFVIDGGIPTRNTGQYVMGLL